MDGQEAPGSHVEGWMLPAELRWLHAKAAGMASVVEVGSHRGRSSYALLAGCPGPVYCIDPWERDPEARPAFDRACGHFPNLTAIRAASPAAAALVPGPVEMVFIDGDHSYDAVRADIAAWLPLATRLLCGHDLHASGAKPGVRSAVEEAFGSAVQVVPGTSLWAVEPTP